MHTQKVKRKKKGILQQLPLGKEATVLDEDSRSNLHKEATQTTTNEITITSQAI